MKRRTQKGGLILKSKSRGKSKWSPEAAFDFLEISGLNTQFNIVAKKIAGLDVEPYAVFTYPPINQYHKESIFVLFSVQSR